MEVIDPSLVEVIPSCKEPISVRWVGWIQALIKAINYNNLIFFSKKFLLCFDWFKENLNSKVIRKWRRVDQVEWSQFLGVNDGRQAPSITPQYLSSSKCHGKKPLSSTRPTTSSRNFSRMWSKSIYRIHLGEEWHMINNIKGIHVEHTILINITF